MTKTVGYNAAKDEDNEGLEKYDEMIDDEERCCPECCWPDDKNCAARVRVFQILSMMAVTLTVPTVVSLNVWRGASDCEAQIGSILWHGASPQRVLSSAFVHGCNLTEINTIYAASGAASGAASVLQSLPKVITSLSLLEVLNVVVGHILLLFFFFKSHFSSVFR